MLAASVGVAEPGSSAVSWSLHLLPGQMGRVTACGKDQAITDSWVQVEILKAQQEPLPSWVVVVEVEVVMCSFQGCPPCHPQESGLF